MAYRPGLLLCLRARSMSPCLQGSAAQSWPEAGSAANAVLVVGHCTCSGC